MRRDLGGKMWVEYFLNGRYKYFIVQSDQAIIRAGSRDITCL